MLAITCGLLTALGWGCADFIARFTGRALGHTSALLGMLFCSALILSVMVPALGLDLAWRPEGLGLVLVTGVGVMVATMLLYAGLVRGPIAVVAPIVGSYPAFNLLLAAAIGISPSAPQWLASVVVLAGVIAVARGAPPLEGGLAPELRTTVLIALASSLAFALTVAAGQAAARIWGELETLFLARWIGVAACLVFFTARRTRPTLPRPWWALLTLQGVLDGGAYAALFAASHAGPGAVIAVVIASGFCAVTVLLARAVLKEPMSLAQWGGIGMIVAGVGALSALRA